MKLLDKVKLLFTIENITPNGKVLDIPISILYGFAWLIFYIAFFCLALDFVTWSIPNGSVIRLVILSLIVALIGAVLAIYSPPKK